MRFFLILACSLAALVFYKGAFAQHVELAPAATPTPRSTFKALPLLKFDPRLQPAYVNLLKRQAKERGVFYDEQAKEKADLKEAQAKERTALLIRHRAARASFSFADHTREERAAFFKGQREEMAQLRARQKAERDKLEVELKAKLAAFHAQQAREEKDLHMKLLEASHAKTAGPVPSTH